MATDGKPEIWDLPVCTLLCPLAKWHTLGKLSEIALVDVIGRGAEALTDLRIHLREPLLAEVWTLAFL